MALTAERGLFRFLTGVALAPTYLLLRLDFGGMPKTFNL